MLWGDQKTFALEAEFRHADGKWRFGRLRMWVAGTPLGDFAETADLATAARWGRTFLASSGNRARPDLESLGAREVFYELFQKYIVSTPATPWDRDSHLLDDVGEASLRDKTSVVVFRQQDGHDRVVSCDWKQDVIVSHLVPAGLLDDTIDGFCRWAEAL